MSTMKTLFAGLMLGCLLGWIVWGPDPSNPESVSVRPKEPLYWVAPMDENYRREKPGKSPMGMDLVPVYEQAKSAHSAGVVHITPDVINNLGVRTARVLPRRWQSEIRTVGYVRYDEDRLVHIHPRVEGWIETLHVKAAGDPVSQGQALYDIYSPQLVNAQEELLLALRRGNSTLVEAAQDRLKALALSDEFIGDLKRRGKVAQSVTFRARQSGVIDNLEIREGFYVGPGTTMMSIGSLDEVWVEAEVFERHAGQVSTGMPVTMRTAYLSNRTWEGRVGYVYPTLDPLTRTLRIRLRFDNADHALRPNMFTEVIIHTADESAADTLVIPREALIRTASQNRVVLALGEGRFKSVAVEAGRIDEQHAEILAGLKEGDLVVSSAQFLLDSESSRESDFQRMHHGASDAGGAL